MTSLIRRTSSVLVCVLTCLMLAAGCPGPQSGPGPDDDPGTVTPPGGNNDTPPGGNGGTPAPAPTAVDDAYTAPEVVLQVGAAQGVLQNDTLTQPAQVTTYDRITSQGGTVDMQANGGFTYVAPDRFNGIDAFTYTVGDAGGSATATVTITVTAPIAPGGEEPGGPPGSGGGGGGETNTAGTAGDDNLIGTDGHDTINGLLGNDTISGGGGNDVLNGDFDTNSATIARTGDDQLLGGDGMDLLVGDVRNNGLLGVITRAGDDVLVGGAGNDSLYGDAAVSSGTITTAGNDTLNGEAGNDELVGDVGILTVTGQLGTAGNDILSGGSGDDVLHGDLVLVNGTVGTCGDDILDGGDGNDTLFGDVETNNGTIGAYGKDILRGGTGDDTLTGDCPSATAGGEDVFVFSAITIFGNDTITDLRPAENDRLRFVGVANQAALLAAVDFAFSAHASGKVLITVTGKVPPVGVRGTILLSNINFTGQASFGDLGITVEAQP